MTVPDSRPAVAPDAVITNFEPAPERITPYIEGGSIEDRVDEIFKRNTDVHFEMMSEGHAFMRIGLHRFYIYARKGKLVLTWFEDEEPRIKPARP